MAEADGKPNPFVRLVVDYAGLAAFLAVFLFMWLGRGEPRPAALLTATWGLVAGSVVGLAAGLVVERRIAPLPLFGGLAALVFGGLALFFHDPVFVKVKPTVINVVLGAVVLGGVALGRNPLKVLFSGALNLSPAGWRTLSIRYGIFFLCMAALNEIVWRTQPEEVWVVFRFPGLLVLALVFGVLQAPMIMRDIRAMEAAAEMEP